MDDTWTVRETRPGPGGWGTATVEVRLPDATLRAVYARTNLREAADGGRTLRYGRGRRLGDDGADAGPAPDVVLTHDADGILARVELLGVPE